MGKQTIKLQSKVAEKFSATSNASRLSDGKWGKVDLNRIDLRTAKRLVDEGFPYLVVRRKD